MKATIEKHGIFDYRARLGHYTFFAFTKWGIMYVLRREARSIRKWHNAQQNAIEVDV